MRHFWTWRGDLYGLGDETRWDLAIKLVVSWRWDLLGPAEQTCWNLR